MKKYRENRARIAPNLSHEFYRRHEAEKRRQCGERVREIEKGSFTPLVFFGHWRSRSLATVSKLQLVSELIARHALQPEQLDGCGAGYHSPCSGQPFCAFVERAEKSKVVKKSPLLRSPRAVLRIQCRFSHFVPASQNKPSTCTNIYKFIPSFV